MYMRQYAWRIIRISKEILQIFSHYFAESATRRRLPQAISKTCGDAPTRRRKKRLRKMEVGLAQCAASARREMLPRFWSLRRSPFPPGRYDRPARSKLG